MGRTWLGVAVVESRRSRRGARRSARGGVTTPGSAHGQASPLTKTQDESSSRFDDVKERVIGTRAASYVADGPGVEDPHKGRARLSQDRFEAACHADGTGVFAVAEALHDVSIGFGLADNLAHAETLRRGPTQLGQAGGSVWPFLSGMEHVRPRSSQTGWSLGHGRRAARWDSHRPSNRNSAPDGGRQLRVDGLGPDVGELAPSGSPPNATPAIAQSSPNGCATPISVV